MVSMKELADNVISGNAPKTEELTTLALKEKMSPETILNDGLIAGMEVVGEKFKNNEFYVPEMLIAARAMKAGMKILQPELTATGVEPIGTFVVGTVKGDLHDIGKNLVAMMMEGAGFKVVDLGVDVTPEKYISAAKENNANMIGMSALLTTTMVNMKTAMDAFEADGITDSVKVMVGGAPLTQNFADEINADGFSPDAASAVAVAKEILGIG
jgi:5-methyltetrahydrofolate--homocysteine methyltransferase